MKIRDIMETASAGATCAGGMAPVAQALSELQTRQLRPRSAKYQNSAPSTGRPGKPHAKR